MNPSAASYLFGEELYRFSSTIVVVLSRDWETYSENERNLLNRMLISVYSNINAVTVLVRPSLDPSELVLFSPAHVLVLGSQLPAGVPLYKEHTAHGFSMVCADDLSVMDDPQKKKELWAVMKPMFGVK